MCVLWGGGHHERENKMEWVIAQNPGEIRSELFYGGWLFAKANGGLTST